MDDLYAKARNYLLRYFIEVATKNKDILDMNLKDFYDVISDDELNTREEDHVWKLCIRWIDHDPENRKRHIAQLMQGVRLGLMTPKVVMVDRVCVCVCVVYVNLLFQILFVFKVFHGRGERTSLCTAK